MSLYLVTSYHLWDSSDRPFKEEEIAIGLSNLSPSLISLARHRNVIRKMPGCERDSLRPTSVIPKEEEWAEGQGKDEEV